MTIAVSYVGLTCPRSAWEHDLETSLSILRKYDAIQKHLNFQLEFIVTPICL